MCGMCVDSDSGDRGRRVQKSVFGYSSVFLAAGVFFIISFIYMRDEIIKYTLYCAINRKRRARAAPRGDPLSSSGGRLGFGWLCRRVCRGRSTLKVKQLAAVSLWPRSIEYAAMCQCHASVPPSSSDTTHHLLEPAALVDCRLSRAAFAPSLCTCRWRGREHC